MEEMQFELLSGNMDWSSADDGHFPNKEVVMIELQGAEPSFIGWIAVENPPGR